MKAQPWNRDSLIRDLNDRIWKYLPSNAQSTERGILIAKALLDWPDDHAARMGELQFLLSDEVGQFLSSLSLLRRTLTTSSAQVEEWDYERLRGPVRWSTTLTLRRTGASPQLWVTAPARREYQTPENQMIVYLLDRIITLGQASGWANASAKGDAARMVQSRIRDSEEALQNSGLAPIERAPLTAQSLYRVRTGRARHRYAAAILAYDAYQSLVHELDLEAIRLAVESAGRVTPTDSILFELLCLFDTIDALGDSGWEMDAIRLFHGRVVVKGTRATQGIIRKLVLHYQSKPKSVTASLYKTLQSTHGFKKHHELRPDMVIEWTTPNSSTRWLLVECKYRQGKNGVYEAAREALKDLLAYRRAFSDLLDKQVQPYGLGIAWGADLRPDCEGEILLATPDTISQAIATLVV